MASSPVSISSNALLLLGQKTIASFVESSDIARLCSNLWPDVRDATLRLHPWNCATKRVSLAPVATPPAFGWSYAFQLPGDWLRTLSVGDDDESPSFAMEGGQILLDAAECKLRYVYREEDVTRWDSLLVGAQTAAMATALAYPITKSAAMQQAMQERFDGLLKQARAINGQEDTGDAFGDSPLLNARYNGSGW